MYLNLKGVFLAAVACACLQAAAETPADTISAEQIVAPLPQVVPQVWTFNDCLDWAVENNTEVRRSMLGILNARQDVLSAKDAWLPTVGFSTNQSFTNYPSTEAGRDHNQYGSSYNVGVNWTAWDGNVRKYRTESARIVEQQRALAGDDAVVTLKLGILEAYLNIMYAAEAVTIAKQTLEVSSMQAERAKRFAEAGRSSQVDYAQIESQRAQDAYNLTQAQSSYESAKLALKKILVLGLDDELEVMAVEFGDAEVTAPLPAASEVYNLAAAWLPQLKSNELSKEIYSNDVKIAKAGRMPSVSVQGGVATGYTSGLQRNWATTMGRNFNENIGLTLSIPIYDGNSTKRAVAKARLAELDYDLNRRDLLDNLSQTVESLYLSASNAQAKYSAGLAQLTATQLSADLVNRQFELGYVNPLDFLTAHNNLLNARLELLQSKYMAILAGKTIRYYATQQLSLN